MRQSKDASTARVAWHGILQPGITAQCGLRGEARKTGACLHGGVKLGDDVDELDEGAVDTAHVGLAHKALDTVHAPAHIARH